MVKKVLVLILGMMLFATSVYAILPIKSIVLTTTMTLEQACKIYQEMWDLETVQSVGNLNYSKTEFRVGDTLKVFELTGTDADGKEYLLPEVDSGVMQVTSVTNCQAVADELKVSLRIFKLSNPLISCP